MRIYSNRFYVTAGTPGISGFQQWDKTVFSIVTGLKARTCARSSVVAEWTPTNDERYRLGNGRLPEYQPVVDAAGVVEFLRSEPFQAAVPVDRAEERLQARPGTRPVS